MTKIISLSEKQLAVMKQLALYRFLTAPQLIQLGVSNSIDSLRKNILGKLQNQGFTKQVKANNYDINRTAYLHYLTRSGAVIIADLQGVDLASINYPTGRVQVVAHIPHMIATVDCAISVRAWAEQNTYILPFAHMDFEKQRQKGAVHHTGRPPSMTAIEIEYDGKKSKESDFLFVATMKQKNYVYAMELENFPDSSNIAKKLMHYTKIIKSGILKTRFGSPVDNFVLSVHVHEKTLRLVPKLLNNQPGFSPFKELFLFNSLEQVKKDITQGWHTVDGNLRNPLPIS